VKLIDARFALYDFPISNNTFFYTLRYYDGKMMIGVVNKFVVNPTITCAVPPSGETL
jgi:hypothetical protein